MTDQLRVELGDRSYPIWILGSVAEYKKLSAKAYQADMGNLAVVCDTHTGQYAQAVDADRSVKVELPSGEGTKSYESLQRIHDEMASHHIDRGGKIIALGGGVIGDLAGFAAATYLRGIDFYQVPTTLLAMVDSSVGGKTGINIAAGKNLVGAFWQPRAVFICTGFLKTLPLQEFAAGMAEVIKYGMLYDSALFEKLEHLEKPLLWDHPELPGVIRRCCEIKAEIVKADEKETAASGGRALLNLGHTFAHAIENVAGYGTYLHGEAVAIGLSLAARLSNELDGYEVSPSDIARVNRLLKTNNLPTDLCTPLRRGNDASAPPELTTDALMDAMRRDKKVRAGKLRFVAMQQLGQAVTVDGVDEALVRTLWADAGAR